MKVSFCVACVLALVAASASAKTNAPDDWVRVSEGKDGSIATFHPNRVKRRGPDELDAWLRVDFAKPEKVGIGSNVKNAAYELLHFRLGCDGATIQGLAFYKYDASGTVVQSATNPGSTSSIIPNSIGESFHDLVCTLAKEGLY